jgi:hypothetical protein
MFALTYHHGQCECEPVSREYLFVIAIIKDNRELLSDNTSAQCDNLPGRVLHNAIRAYMFVIIIRPADSGGPNNY